MNNLGRYFEKSYKLMVFLISFTTLSMILIYYYINIKQLDIYSDIVVRNSVKTLVTSCNNDKISKDELFNQIFNLFHNTDYSAILKNENGKIVKQLRPNDLLYNGDTEDRLATIAFSLKTDEKYKLIFISTENFKFLTYYPFILLLVVTFLLLLIYSGIKLLKTSEKNLIWAGMAKEAAHQLGTPLTSLEGWSEFLSEFHNHNLEINEAYQGINKDILRMKVVVERFSQIASIPKMKYCSINEIINDTVNYLSTRMPQKSNPIKITAHLIENTELYMNDTLMKWVIENLIKNSIQAIPQNKKGEIDIFVFTKKNTLFIDIKDNGTGIDSKFKREIFDTGFTTKQRGWGIGLSLAKKAIKNYHNGNIYIKETAMNKGTTIRIELNKLVT